MFIYSPHRHSHVQSDDSTSNVASNTDVQISPEVSNQSAIERAALEVAISGNSWLCVFLDLPCEMYLLTCKCRFCDLIIDKC